jgi:hypothetical protein
MLDDLPVALAVKLDDLLLSSTTRRNAEERTVLALFMSERNLTNFLLI